MILCDKPKILYVFGLMLLLNKKNCGKFFFQLKVRNNVNFSFFLFNFWTFLN